MECALLEFFKILIELQIALKYAVVPVSVLVCSFASRCMDVKTLSWRHQGRQVGS